MYAQRRIATDQSNGTIKKGIKRRHTNYGDATRLEIAQVARAATAAPFYLEPLVVGNKTVFTDGGQDTRSNPTDEGIQEVEEQFGDGSLEAVVSIGTAKKAKIAKKSFRSRGLALIDLGSNPEAVHERIENRGGSYYYFRFNDVGGLDMDFDDWYPRKKRRFRTTESGAETMKAIEDAWIRWAGKLDTINCLKDCAKVLVDLRRERARDDARWERFATCAEFRCRVRTCPADVFYSRAEFVRHHRQAHPDAAEEDPDECKRQWRYRRRQAAPS